MLEIDRSGLVETETFVDTIRRLRLLQTNAQLQAVLDLYSSTADPELIAYEEFCADLDKASTSSLGDSSRSIRRSAAGLMSADKTTFSSSIRKYSLRPARDEYSDLDDVPDDPFAPKNVGKWYAREASPKQRRQFDNVFDSLEQFRQSNTAADPIYDHRTGGAATRYGIADYDDIDPKPTESIRLSGTSGLGGQFPARSRHSRYGAAGASMESPRYGDSTRLGPSYRSPSPARHKSPETPRSPPGKVGTAMWGSNTPLGQKGLAPSIDATHWVCAVCYYTENSKGVNKCEVCDSANTSNQKVSYHMSADF